MADASMSLSASELRILLSTTPRILHRRACPATKRACRELVCPVSGAPTLGAPRRLEHALSGHHDQESRYADDGSDRPEAARLMADKDVGSVPIVDKSGHAVRTVTEHDIAIRC